MFLATAKHMCTHIPYQRSHAINIHHLQEDHMTNCHHHRPSVARVCKHGTGEGAGLSKGTHTQVCCRYRIIRVKSTPPRIAVSMLWMEQGQVEHGMRRMGGSHVVPVTVRRRTAPGNRPTSSLKLCLNSAPSYQGGIVRRELGIRWFTSGYCICVASDPVPPLPLLPPAAGNRC